MKGRGVRRGASGRAKGRSAGKRAASGRMRKRAVSGKLRAAARSSFRKAATKKVSRRAGKSQRAVKRRVRRLSRQKIKRSTMMFDPLEQVTVKCENCGRSFNIVKLHGLSTEGMICQRCSVGEIEFPE
ncbi:hypothetical protein HYX10_02040 [Candidatus Woesearchaeota archaeon]|nr:hypothetical protein [Candidatus Woesearchaeota archaeon]